MIVAASSFYHSLKDLELEERPEGLHSLRSPRPFLNPHRTKNHTPCPLDELLAYLQSKRRQISGIVYSRRTDTPDIFEDLWKTEILVIKTTLISRRKRQNPAVIREYLQLHQSSELELKSPRVVLSHRDHLPGILSRIRAQTKKTSQGRRRAKARREERLAADSGRSATTNKW